MENMKKKIKIGMLDICPFFYPDPDDKKQRCDEEVNFLYVVEYCLKGFRRCRVFAQRSLTEMKTPEEWVNAILWSLNTIELDEYVKTRDYIKCPMYSECSMRIVYDHFESKCCKDFDKCDNFYKLAHYTYKPSSWYKNLIMITEPLDEEDDDKW